MFYLKDTQMEMLQLCNYALQEYGGIMAESQSLNGNRGTVPLLVATFIQAICEKVEEQETEINPKFEVIKHS